MKALLYKDLMCLWKNLRTYLLLCAGFQLLSIVNADSGFLRFYPTILVATIPNSLLAYEERDKWDKLSLTLPVSRKMLVTSKYLMGLILLGGITVLSAITGLIRDVNATGFDLIGLGFELGWNLMLGMLIQCIVLPATFRLGAEKGRLIYGICLGLAAGLFLIVVIAMTALSTPEPQPGWWINVLIAAFMLLMLHSSWCLSVRFYEKREF